MRRILVLLTLAFSANLGCSQTQTKSGPGPVDQIKAHIEWIDQQTDFVVAELNGEDYLENVPDQGAELKGYYKNDTLFKVVEWVGLSYGAMNTTYYLWHDELICVYAVEQHYKELMDSAGLFLGFDYSQTELQYEARHYFAEGKEVKKFEKGNPSVGLPPTQHFASALLSFRPLLKNKRDNQAAYDQIQGSWVSTVDTLNVVEFDGLRKIEYYDGAYMGHAKIKIEKGFLYCRTPEQSEEDKYEIVRLTNSDLTLLYVPAGRLLKYKRETAQ